MTLINDPPRPMVARSPRSVRIFSASRPLRPFVDVATIAVKQTHQLNEEGDGLMVEELRKRAAAMGCDGLVLGGSSEYRGTDSDSVLSLLDPAATIMRATCIVYLEDDRARGLTGTRVSLSGIRPAADEDGSDRRAPQRSDREEPRPAH